MNKKTLSLSLLSIMLFAGFVGLTPIVSAHDAPFPPGYSYQHLTIDTISQPNSLDPAWAYDSVSAEPIMNVYETLIFFDTNCTYGPYRAGKTGQFVPHLATSLPIIEHFTQPGGPTNSKSGLPIYSQFTFPIRTGVKFHHGPFPSSAGILTPRDVEYSFERVMVQDRTAGPAWLLYEPLLGVYGATPPSVDPDWGIKIDGAVEVDGTNVVFNLAMPYPDLAFKQILCQTWSSVMSEAWAVNEGDLNMAEVAPIPPSTNPWSNWTYIYNKWWNPQTSFLEDAINRPDPMKDGGTGPYRMTYWTRDTAWSIRKYDEYVAPNENLGRPASWPAPVTGSLAPLGGYLDTVTWYIVLSWQTRLDDFLTGRRDMIYVPRCYRDQVLGQIVGGEPVRCLYPFNLLALDAFFFTLNISETAVPRYVPVMLPPDTFGSSGIPPNIFGRHSVTGVDEGLNVRKGFAYAFNYLKHIDSSYLGEASQPADPVISDLAYDRPTRIEDETWEKHNEAGPTYGRYDAGESIYYDADNSFNVSGSDILIQGPALPVGTPLISFGILFDSSGSFDEKHAENQDEDGWYNGEEAKYADINGNGDWDIQEPAIRDTNDNSAYDILDTVLAGDPPQLGMTLAIPDDFERYADINLNSVWDLDEPAIRDNDNNGFFDPAIDTVLVGTQPSKGAVLRNTVRESVYRDHDHDGTVSGGDTHVSGPLQPQGTPLVSFVGKWKYVYNPSLATYYLKLAWGGVDANGNGIVDPLKEPGDVEGALWINGMSFSIVWNTRNPARGQAASMLATKINGLNPSKFFLTDIDVEWGIVYLRDKEEHELPVFIAGWTADLTDPHDFVHPFMHSRGTIAASQRYSNATVDLLIEEGINPNNPNPAGTYTTLQQIYHTDIPSVPIIQGRQYGPTISLAETFGRHWEQAWVRGWYHNPLYGGSLVPGIESTAPATPTLDAYHMWKAKTHFGDVNWDGIVGGADWTGISAHWTGPPAGPGGFNPRADLTGGTGATIGGGGGKVRGIPDGKVDIADLSLVSAYWDVPPGPKHGPPWVDP